MTGFIFALTLRRLALRKSNLVLLALAALPVVIALIFRLSNAEDDPREWAAEVLLANMLMTLVVPLVALVLGTAVLGDELEDGTAVYLLTKPIPRWQIVLPQVGAAWLISGAILLPPALLASYIALESLDALVFGFAVGIAAQALAYAALFVLFSALTSHALIAGLVYVFLWEGALAGIFEGLRYLAVRHYAMGIADWLGGTPEHVFDAYLNGGTALVLLVLLTSAAGFLAVRRYERLQIAQPT